MSFPSCLLLKTHRADFQSFWCLLSHKPHYTLTLVISRLEVKPSRSPGSPLHESSRRSTHLRQRDRAEFLTPENERKVPSDKTLSAMAKFTSPLRSEEIMASFSRKHLGLCTQG